MVKSVYYFVNVILFLLCTATGQVGKIHGFKNAKDVGGGGGSYLIKACIFTF